jgi:hypothetical protein
MGGPVAIIGAGVAGLAAARRLADGGFAVRVFEKSRGLGGRSATRRRDGYQFDHGAQYFTVRSSRFRHAAARGIDEGWVAAWSPRAVRLASDGSLEPATVTDRYVGVPGMSSLGRGVAGDLRVEVGIRIAELRREGSRDRTLVSTDGDRFEAFGAVVVSCPPPQSAVLLSSASPGLAAVCRSAVMRPCWAVMAAFDSPLGLDFDAAFVADRTLAWASREASKPGRVSRPECWTLHGTPEWSDAQLEEDPDRVARALLDRFFELAGLAPRTPILLEAHRWRYARSADPRGADTILDPDARIAIAGDWTVGDRLEDAWLSGIEAAESIVGVLGGR